MIDRQAIPEKEYQLTLLTNRLLGLARAEFGSRRSSLIPARWWLFAGAQRVGTGPRRHGEDHERCANYVYRMRNESPFCRSAVGDGHHHTLSCGLELFSSHASCDESGALCGSRNRRCLLWEPDDSSVYYIVNLRRSSLWRSGFTVRWWSIPIQWQLYLTHEMSLLFGDVTF